MKKIITTKARVFMTPHQRSLRRLFKRVFTSVIKKQDMTRQQELLDELMRWLKRMERKIDASLRALTRQAKHGE